MIKQVANACIDLPEWQGTEKDEATKYKEPERGHHPPGDQKLLNRAVIAAIIEYWLLLGNHS